MYKNEGRVELTLHVAGVPLTANQSYRLQLEIFEYDFYGFLEWAVKEGRERHWPQDRNNWSPAHWALLEALWTVDHPQDGIGLSFNGPAYNDNYWADQLHATTHRKWQKVQREKRGRVWVYFLEAREYRASWPNAYFKLLKEHDPKRLARIKAIIAEAS